MSGIIFFIIVLLTFPVFLIPKGYKHIYSFIVLISGVLLTSGWSVCAFTGSIYVISPDSFLPFTSNIPEFTIDRLTAFFIIVINITVPAGLLYSRGYLRQYYETRNSIRFSIHYFSYLWLYISMLMVVMIRDGLFFLIVWEIMALSSFLLVIFDAEDTSVMKTGISYLIQMHAGMFFLLAGFLIIGKETGKMSFDTLGQYFSGHNNILLFLLFFTGFGIKAGFIPFHTWLPQAHPAAPSHVSGVMSGVMIKMGIYGIIRVIMSVQQDLILIGILILAVSVLSGIMGIMMAIVQKDLKRVLAYSSIENIGIIGIATGLGTLGIATGNDSLTLLGMGGALLHLLNHSLFKSLLFFNSGSVYTATHTRNMESMGGLMKRMPLTSVLFLIGSLAICGLPPFNGFISEYIIYLGMVKGLSHAGLYQSIILLGSIVSLSLIGGLAAFCFSKTFGLVFLGESRTVNASAAEEVEKSMIYPQVISVALIVVIGIASPVFVRPVFTIITDIFGLTVNAPMTTPYISNLTGISIAGGAFVLMVTGILLYRNYHLKSRAVKNGPVWSCGYTATSPKQQYTSASFAYNFNHLAKPVLQTRKIMNDIGEEEIFPGKRSFRSESEDIYKRYLIDKPVDLVSKLLKRIAVMQTGRIQDYILYAFVFMLVVLILTWFNIL
jgi:formate hydrogenlyase subunit 3/multisubunit Na+/H+ antiporter MnhD subunit